MRGVAMPGARAWVLSRDLNWVPCAVFSSGRLLQIRGARIECGMSGGPILNAEGHAIGVISTGDAHFSLNASLADCVPPWLSRKFAADQSDGVAR